MRILTLFIALFLTFMPEETAIDNAFSRWQDVCYEQVDDVEEEAVIRSESRCQKQIDESRELDSLKRSCYTEYSAKPRFIHMCFERQWLTHCMLRL